MSLPVGWTQVVIGQTIFYVHRAAQVASVAIPTGVQVERKSRVTKEAGTYAVLPQPKDMPDGWEQALALNPDGKSGTFIYHNVTEELTQMADPRPKGGNTEDPLPIGWSQMLDEDGDICFYDHNSGIQTYDDPRHVEVDESQFDEEVENVSELASVRIAESGAPPSAWKIVNLDLKLFNRLAQNLIGREDLPPQVAVKTYNRYMNILPNPRTMVKLQSSTGNPVEQYINANFVAGYDGNPQSYIATMGPLPVTIGAFWRMIWQTKAVCIVMTTGLIENGIEKCARYWPTVRYNDAKKIGDVVYDDISVAVMKGERFPGYLQTTLRLKKGDVTHTVSHFHYTEWPDHGVPTNYENVLGLLKTVRATSKQAGVPTVVHCSAGIGRTGSFIAIDVCCALLESVGDVDVNEVISKLRDDRGGMVQHPQQYEFVHRACIEYAKMIKQEFVLVNADDTLRKVKQAPVHEEEEVQEAEELLTETVETKSAKEAEEDQAARELAELIAKGQPAGISDIDWRKLKRQHQKNQAREKARHSMRKRLSDAELHGELRLGTLTKVRKGVNSLFP